MKIKSTPPRPWEPEPPPAASGDESQECSAMNVFCLDASACSLLSEDYGLSTSRFHFQQELISCQTRACLTDGAAGGAGRRLAPEPPCGPPPPGRHVALVASSGGRAAVALHPSGDAAALQQALREVRPSGEANLEAALKLALLVSRRLPSHAVHVTAFVASPGAPASLAACGAAAAELRQRYRAAGVALDVVLLCPRSELAAPALAALEALTGGCPSTSQASHGDGAEEVAGTWGRLVCLTPVLEAAESWQQLEPALEQLEGSRGAAAAAARTREGSSSSGGGGGAATAARGSCAAPPFVSRRPQRFDPLRHPRAPLLALRSGVLQPALCRGESLSRLGHLSSDGMARPWLPTYSSLARQAEAAGRDGGGGVAAGAAADSGMVYVEVQPIPKWRTLIKAAAGRMHAASTEADSSGFAAASSDLLRSLDALSALSDDEGEAAGARQAGSGSSGGNGGGGRAEAPTRFSADPRRGTLRLLQATKEPEQLKLVWSAEPAACGRAGAGSKAPALDLFGSGGCPGSGSGSSSGGAPTTSAARSALLSYMPPATLAAAAARGPVVHQGVELWEAAAEWEWELDLPAAAAAGGGDAVEVQARQAANGAQLLLVTPRGRARRRPPGPTAAFWLQQRLGAGALRLPAYATLAEVSSAPPSPPSSCCPTADAGSGLPQQGQAEPQSAAPTHQEGGAAALAAALLRALRSPPGVDVRRLRRDVKAGLIQVTPITVGPLPAQIVRELVSTRATLMGGMGVENLDSWGGEGLPADSRQGSADLDSGRGAAPAPDGPQEQHSGGAGQAHGPRAAAAAVAARQHKSAVLSLLRERLRERAAAARDAVRDAGEPAPAPAARGGEPGGEPAAHPAAEAAAAIERPEEADDCAPSTPKGRSLRLPPASQPDSCCSSGGGTPFGTPLHILPSSLLHRQRSAEAGGQPGGSCEEAAGDADGQEGKKPGDGPALLVAHGQAEGGDGEQPMFQLD